MLRNVPSRMFVSAIVLAACTLFSDLAIAGGKVPVKGGVKAAGQRSGGPSSGGGQRTGRSALTWVSNSIDGVVPAVSGSVTVSTYITTLGVDVRVGRVNLPDNTPLTVTVYASDYYTGKPWLPKRAGIINLVGGKGVLVSSALWTTAPRGIPAVTSVVITAPDGTVVAAGAP